MRRCSIAETKEKKIYSILIYSRVVTKPSITRLTSKLPPLFVFVVSKLLFKVIDKTFKETFLNKKIVEKIKV